MRSDASDDAESIEMRSLLDEQVRYYRERAPEYDEWFLRQGRYDRGQEHTAQWNSEADQIREVLGSQRTQGRILEVASGTGLWTVELAKWSDAVVIALDASPEVLRINRDRVRNSRVHYLAASAFDPCVTGPFDMICFGFWLTHVPPSKFKSFWEWVASITAPNGRVFFVDNKWYPEYRWGTGSEQKVNEAPAKDSWKVSRRLNDGRRFNIVKTFYEVDDLKTRLSELGWHGHIAETQRFFLWGAVQRV